MLILRNLILFFTLCLILMAISIGCGKDAHHENVRDNFFSDVQVELYLELVEENHMLKDDGTVIKLIREGRIDRNIKNCELLEHYLFKSITSSSAKRKIEINCELFNLIQVIKERHDLDSQEWKNLISRKRSAVKYDS